MANIFNVRTAKPDVELLMQGVAERVRRFEAGEGGDREIKVFSLYPVGWEDDDTESNVELLGAQWDIDSQEIIHSNHPIFGPTIIAFQSIVRRLTWWFLNPIIDQISQFNRTAARVIHSLFRQQHDATQQTTEITVRLEAAENTIAEMAKRIEELEKTQ
jgi:hypothetical protein